MFSASIAACSKATTSEVSVCEPLTGTPWVPSISGASSSNHDWSVTVTKEVITTSGPLVGLTQAAPSSKEIAVNIDMTQDLGGFGSLTILAEPVSFPSGRVGSAYPLLVSLSDGTHEMLNLPRSGASGDCAQAGYFQLSGGELVSNPGCTIGAPSAYRDTDQWLNRQLPIFGFASVNTFPTCNFAGGSGTAALPSCAFNSDFFVSGKLRSGVTYTAKYVMIASNYTSIGDGSTVGLKVTAVKKRSPRAVVGGAVDLNIVLVGQKNVSASRTAQGKRNLDTLFSLVQEHLSQASSGVQLGTITVYEWGCAEGGDTFATSSLDSSGNTNYLGKLFARGSSMVSSSSEGKALNVFLVSSITLASLPSTQKIAGLSGGLGGPPINGLQTSGLAFISNEKLGTYNRLCSSSPCPLTTQDPEFYDMSATIAHEIGHFLGLNHPSESAGTTHDPVLDTPVCTNTEVVGGSSMITSDSCYLDNNNHPLSAQKCAASCPSYDPSQSSYCAAAEECQFNHLMWWFAKKFTQSTGQGDGNILSDHSGVILNYNSFVR